MKGKEAILQANCVVWFSLQHPHLAPLLFHIPNGGSRNPLEAKNLKRQGVKAGVPDLFLAKPSNGYCGLFIEMKYGKNKLTPLQDAYFMLLNENGFKCAVCYDFDSFRIIINQYLMKDYEKINCSSVIA